MEVSSILPLVQQCQTPTNNSSGRCEDDRDPTSKEGQYTNDSEDITRSQETRARTVEERGHDSRSTTRTGGWGDGGSEEGKEEEDNNNNDNNDMELLVDAQALTFISYVGKHGAEERPTCPGR
jgi:hypothetical protein